MPAEKGKNTAVNSPTIPGPPHGVGGGGRDYK